MGLHADQDATSALRDLPGENPYSALIEACDDDPRKIQFLYATHRSNRNAQQKAKFLARPFGGLAIDQTILRLERPHIEPGFRDERNCLVFWARPPEHVVLLAAGVQEMLRGVAPGLWLMPPRRMHMTVLEVAFAKTPREIASLVSTLREAIPRITSHTYLHRARLVKPIVSYDTSALALSFLPAAGEERLSPPPDASAGEHVAQHDGYTYHHLRRDVFGMARAAGVPVGSRYQVPSAHVTLGRFLDEADHDTREKRERWISAVEEVNAWLEREVWHRGTAEEEACEFVAEWVVGQERGLDARSGALWYGGGRTIMLGEGF